MPRPSSWPVRWRLATVSAGLTLTILLLFGGAIGKVATQRIRDDFNKEVASSAQALAREIRIVQTIIGPRAEPGPRLKTFLIADDAAARIIDSHEAVIEASRGAAALGPLRAGVVDNGEMRVATAPVLNESGVTTGFVQYGRSLSHVEATIRRLWLFIAAGIVAGTLLAILAGVAIAARAMRPIASLTARAREVAATRDPSREMPAPTSEDEVGELARTLQEMLRALDAARTEREGAMQKQREFVADASHELRTPLTSVLANLELLQASLHSPGEAEEREMVDSALRSSRRMSRLVADLLMLARADAGRHGSRRRCDLATIAGDAAAEASPVVRDHQLSVDMPKPVFVVGNADELHRMVLNLLDNAASHTPSGCRIELSLRGEGADAVLEVADDGPGVPVEEREQIFERFARGNGPADIAGRSGTGLGLAIVRSVAETHGGTVAVSDSADGGALFTVRIPLSRAGASVVGDSLETL